MKTTRIWINRISWFGIVVCFLLLVIFVLSPLRATGGPLKFIISVILISGIYLHYKLSLHANWARIVLMIAGGIIGMLLGLDFIFVVVGTFQSAKISWFYSIGTFMTFVFQLWLIALYIRFLRISHVITDEIAMMNWMRKNIYITATIIAVSCATISSGHLPSAFKSGMIEIHVSFFDAMSATSGLFFCGFWGWGVWHLSMAITGTLLFFALLSFLYLKKGVVIIKIPCFIISALAAMAGPLILVSIFTHPIYNKAPPIEVALALLVTAIGIFFGYWFYDAIRYLFNPGQRRADL